MALHVAAMFLKPHNSRAGTAPHQRIFERHRQSARIPPEKRARCWQPEILLDRNDETSDNWTM